MLAYPKFKLTENEIDFLLSQEILPWFHIVTVPSGRKFVKKDSQDDMFIWCALEGKADALVSGDVHLLKLKGSPVSIFSVSKFLKMINPQ